VTADVTGRVRVPEDEDTPGLAGERTDLAWSRSGLALIVTGAAVLKRVFEIDHDQAPALVFAVLLAGAAAWAIALTHARVVASSALAGEPHANARKFRAVAAGTAVLAVGAMVLAILPEG
jgi:uncharacterized membrane protein YidH (DUF202 family)